MQRVSNNSEILVNTIAWFNTYSWCTICQKNNNNRKKRQHILKLGRFVCLLSPNWLHKRNFCFVILWLIKSKHFHFYPSICFQPLILLRNICMHIPCLHVICTCEERVSITVRGTMPWNVISCKFMFFVVLYSTWVSCFVLFLVVAVHIVLSRRIFIFAASNLQQAFIRIKKDSTKKWNEQQRLR